MAKYRCKVCGYIHNCINIDGRDQIPEKCPVCGAYRSAFILIQPDMIKFSDYFNLLQPGWWILHLFAVSLVFIIGRLVLYGIP